MSQEENKSFKLNDNAISHLAKVIQVAILTGTDIIDHMRMLEFIETEDAILDINEKYSERFESAISDMLKNLPGDEQSV